MKPSHAARHSLTVLVLSALVLALLVAGYQTPPTARAVSGTYPDEPFNGMQITYSVGGATFGEPVDDHDFTTSRTYEGSLDGSTITVSGSGCMGSGYGASLSASISVEGGQGDSFSTYIETDYPNVLCEDFSLSVAVPPDATSASFRISMTGDYNAGTRGLVVSGDMTRELPTETPTPGTPTSTPTSTPVPEDTPTPSPTPTETPTPSPTTEPPVIEEVKACIGGPYYFEPQLIELPDNTYTARVNWKTLVPDSVLFTLNDDDTIAEEASDDGASHTYSLASDIRYGLPYRANVLRMQAIGLTEPDPETEDEPQKVPSEPMKMMLYGVRMPDWLPIELMNVTVPDTCEGDPIEAAWDTKYPDPALEFTINCPSFVPYLGGRSLGIQETQASMELKLKGNGEGSLKLAGQTGFSAGGQSVIGSIYGEGTMNMLQCIQLQKAAIGLDIAAKIEMEESAVDVLCKSFTAGVCPLRRAETFFAVGRVVRWFNNLAKLKAEFGVGVGGMLEFEKTCTQASYTWKSSIMKAGGNIQLALIMSLVDDKLDATASGGGKYEVQLNVPRNPTYAKEASASLSAELVFTIWRWQKKFSTGTEWKWIATPSLASLADTSGEHATAVYESDWQPAPRDYADDPDSYAVFHGGQSEREPAASLSSAAPAAVQETLYVSDIFPYGPPALAANPQELSSPRYAMAWVYDDIQKPAMQSEEIYASTSEDGQTWVSLSGVTNDSYQDFSPQVAFGGTTPVLVWERNNTIQTAELAELSADYTNAFDIAYSYWTGYAWTAPMTVTENSVMDISPMLANSMHDGSLLLTWQQNPAGELIGSTASPDTILYTFWQTDTVSWTTPAVLLNDVAGLIERNTAVYDAETMAMVYSQDTDDDLSTSTDQELFLTTWDGVAWSSPQQITDDAQPDNNPTLFYDDQGNLRLLWVKGDTLYALIGSLSATPTPVVQNGPASLPGYRATQGADGSIHIIWQDYSEEGVDLFTTTYDDVTGTFGGVRQITADAGVEARLNAVVAADGTLEMAYTKTAISHQTVTVSSTLVIDDVATFGQTDLYTAQRTPGPDLQITADDISFDPPNPAPGADVMINITLHNVGEFAAADPQVNIYLGSPTAGGTLITTAVPANATLTSGMSTTLRAPWTLPTTGAPFTIYAVADPSNTLAETDEQNNTAYTTVSHAELVLESVSVGYGGVIPGGVGQTITFSATVRNDGYQPVSNAILSFWDGRPSDSSTVIASQQITFLEAGGVRELNVPWEAPADMGGTHLIYAVLTADAVPESNTDNNTKQAVVFLLPDVALSQAASTLQRNDDGSTDALVRLSNIGTINAPQVVLGAYRVEDVAGSGTLTPTALVSTTLAMAAGEQQDVTLALPASAPSQVAVVADLSDDTPDRDISNNMLVLEQAGGTDTSPTDPDNEQVYLPLVMR